MKLKPLSEEWNYWKEWFKENYPEKYEDATSRTSPLQNQLSMIYRILNIDGKEYETKHRRGLFFAPLYTNYREFLTDKIREGQLKEADWDWEMWWEKKSKQRFQTLQNAEQTQKDILFMEKIREKDLDIWLQSRIY